MIAWLKPFAPAAPHPYLRDADGGGLVEEEYAKDVRPRSLAGMTRAERVAAGCGTTEDAAEYERERRQWRAWLESAAGQEWLRNQPWNV